MKTFLTTVSAFALMATSAAAADLAYKAAPQAVAPIAFSWTGLYFGVDGGLGYQNSSQVIIGTNNLTNTLVGIGLVPPRLNTSGGGGIAGGQIGYNYQIGMFVVGAEADIQWSSIKGSDAELLTTAPLNLRRGAFANLGTMGSSALDWYGTLRARAGFVMPQIPLLLIYGTGGLAYGSITDQTVTTLATSVTPLNGVAADNSSSTRTGYTVGAGAEYAITPHVTLKTEYQYLNFGSHTDTYGMTILRQPLPFAVTQSDNYQIGKVGVNYKW